MEEVKTNSYQNIGVLKSTFSNLIKEGVARIGIQEAREISSIEDIENMDLIIATDEDTSLWEPLFLKCDDMGIPVMFAFNFGIGACITVCQPKKFHPFFIFDNQGKAPRKWMVDYTRQFNSFWNVTNHSWLDSVEKWLTENKVENSIGIYAISLAVVHTLNAMVYGEQIEVYPKFYLLSMANHH